MAKAKENNKQNTEDDGKQEFMIVNDNDGNDSFTVMAEDANDAAHKALEELGWWVAQ